MTALSPNLPLGGSPSSAFPFSSTLATYASTNPYLPSVDPRPLILDEAASNATLAVLHSLRQKDLDVPSASYSAPSVNVYFPGVVEGIDGAFATKVLDSIPRAEDWRFLNQLSSEDLARKASALELQVC